MCNATQGVGAESDLAVPVFAHKQQRFHFNPPFPIERKGTVSVAGNLKGQSRLLSLAGVAISYPAVSSRKKGPAGAEIRRRRRNAHLARRPIIALKQGPLQIIAQSAVFPVVDEEKARFPLR